MDSVKTELVEIKGQKHLSLVTLDSVTRQRAT